jgi:hypothetical protein
MMDVRMRVKGAPEITTDQWKRYIPAVEASFGRYVDFAQLIKIFKNTPGGAGRYSPGECCGTKTEIRQGNPDPAHISTSYVERPHHAHVDACFTRLTNAFSKSWTIIFTRLPSISCSTISAASTNRSRLAPQWRRA